MRAAGILAVVSCLLAAGGAAAGQVTREDAVLSEVGIDQRLDSPVPLDAEFRDETGRAVKLGDYLGERPVVLALVYYECPMLCTLTLNGLVRALKVLEFRPGKEFDVVTISINPEETPELAAAKKKNYLERYGRTGTDAGWHFLTGEEDSIRAVADAVGFRYKYLPEKKQFAHAAGIMLVTPTGKLARYFYGVEFAPRDLRLGLIEASGNRIGNPVDQVLLYCYQYDPSTGKYGAVAMNMVRLGGAVTVFLIAVSLAIAFRRERRTGAAGKGASE